MIDHVSIGVRELARSAALYEAMLAALDHTRLITHEHTVGFGKKYPELWLNERKSLAFQNDTGTHICLRAKSIETVQAFHRIAIEHGATDNGAPGQRPEYHASYYAAFIRDFDGNTIEVVTFVATP